MPNGIIVVDKPEGWTSMDICAKLRGIFHERRVGHGGTLDPMATGVLPVFVGRATRAVSFAAESDKEYMTGLKLGIVTDTQDITGTVLETHSASVSQSQLLDALESFRGDIVQVPPMYSAIKQKGKPLYQLARKGIEVEREPRPIHIETLELLEGLSQDNADFILRVVCSKGTYVRTLCHDIGQVLGCGGVMSSLRRVRSFGFTEEQAVTLEEILQAAHQGEAEKLLRPVDICFQNHPDIYLSPSQEKKVRNGVVLSLPELSDGEYRVYGKQSGFLALSRAEKGKLTTIKSFFTV